MLDIIQKGGPLMYLIVICSILAAAVFIERLIHFHRAKIHTEKFMNGIRNIIKKGNVVEAISICEQTPGPVAFILKEGLIHHESSKDEIKETIEEAGLHEVPRLEKNLVILATVAHITPLLGLLGTVSGMIKAFMKIQEKAGIVNPGDLAQGIWEALITTAGGLAIAIPAYVAYNYLVSRVDGFLLDMEKSSNELINILTNKDSFEPEY
ncbi:MotA/TolQ/ExbB proton channel family protein [Chlamydiota bacterium]